MGINNQHITMYIKNKRGSSRIKACSPFKYSYNLKDLYFEMLTFHILNINFVINEQMNAGFYDLNFQQLVFHQAFFKI